jgi:FkbM family methyltransferase
MSVNSLIQRLERNRQKVKLIGLASLFKVKYPTSSEGAHLKLKLPIVKNDVFLRKHSIDLKVFKYVFYDQFHKPIPEVRLRKNPVIVDLGANIGLSILTFNYWYPGSRIIGYEMDEDNYELAKKNTSSLSNVQLINKAVHHKPTIVYYDKHGREDGYSAVTAPGNSDATSVSAVSISDIIRDNALSSIDYLKMDIEGAEIDILNNSDLSWLDHVDNIDIEFHLEESEDLAPYIKTLEKKGFSTYLKKDHWSSISAIKIAQKQ